MTESVVIAGGCFWCMEAVFQQVRGVLSVENGYSNGHTEKVDYRAVCAGTTGYAEVVKLAFDPEVVPLEALLDIFMVVHDPTSLNRQGNDVGTQYRSALYAHSPEQLRVLQDYVQRAQTHFAAPIVTEVAMLERYQRAEDYHQNYFVNNPEQGYCAMVVAPKVGKFRHYFADWQK